MDMPILHIDATPNADYPLRILRAYLAESDGRYSATTNQGENSPVPVWMAAMNAAQVERAKYLRDAIGILERAERWEQIIDEPYG